MDTEQLFIVTEWITEYLELNVAFQVKSGQLNAVRSVPGIHEILDLNDKLNRQSKALSNLKVETSDNTKSMATAELVKEYARLAKQREEPDTLRKEMHKTVATIKYH